jgi:hypothetical protein
MTRPLSIFRSLSAAQIRVVFRQPVFPQR